MPRGAWQYALIALIGGLLFTWGVYVAGIGAPVFFRPVVPILEFLGYVPAASPTTEPDELPFSVYEAFLAFASAALFWVIVVPVIVWLVAGACLRWAPGRRTDAVAVLSRKDSRGN